MSVNIKTLNSSLTDTNNIFRDWHEDQKKRRRSFFKHKKKVNIRNRYLLIGAPNVGKSTFFNKITTSTAMVSNIDRMTNDDIVGKFRRTPSNYLIDLPGVYNLSHTIDEEMVVAHEIFHEQFHKVLNVIAASSIRRDLFLTIQLVESGKLSTVAINMIDELSKNAINTRKLKSYLNNVNIVLTQANRNRGIRKVEKSILHKRTVDPVLKIYPTYIEELINKISIHIPNRMISQRYYSLMVLENNHFVLTALKKKFPNAYKNIMNILKNVDLKKTSESIIDARNKYIEQIMNDCIRVPAKHIVDKRFSSKRIDHYLLKRWIGIPAFVLLMFVTYFLAFGP
jgi:ferrous iron transport protein B